MGQAVTAAQLGIGRMDELVMSVVWGRTLMSNGDMPMSTQVHLQGQSCSEKRETMNGDRP